MKVVFVSNPHSADARGIESRTMAELHQRMPNAEVHVQDFMVLREVLPISVVPCVFIALDELTDQFDPEDVLVAITAAQEAIQARRKQAKETAPGN